MDSNQVAIATITWARSPVEEARLRRSVEMLAHTGLPIAVADRGANPSFGAFLRRLEPVTIAVPETLGLVAQVQASFGVAATFGRDFILYTEADKGSFFAHGLSSFVQRAPQANGLGVVLASRSAGSFASFPPMQRYTEGVINHLCSERFGVQGDYSYGPLVIGRALLQHVATLGDHLEWGWRPSVCLAAHRAGLQIVHIVDDYPCPPDQREEDDAERIHRMRQLSQNIAGLID